jgi:hypothetical protein
MSEENQLLSKELEEKIREGILENERNKGFTCSEIAPKNSSLIDSGRGRCVFERDDSVIKVAKNHEGIAQNSSVFHIMDQIQETKDNFAMPIDAIEGIAVKQEKVKPYHKVKGREKTQQIIEDWEDGWTTEQKEMNDKMTEAAEKDGLSCSDFQNPYNWGVKNDQTVLLDLGECHPK